MSRSEHLATGRLRTRHEAVCAGAHALGRRMLAAMAIVVLAAGCAGRAGSTAAPTSTPSPTATPTATATPRPSATPTATTVPGQMTHGRSTHTATALADGRVLVAGGYFNSAPITLTDLYDPGAGTFTATGAMATARGFDTATRLADGRVLFVGGNPKTWDFSGPFLASAELYDPKTGTFSPTGPLATARNLHTATLLLDGRVLIVGGNDTFNHSLTSAELYDPKTGTFSPTGSMTTARGFHAATLLADGRVLIAGGGSAGWTSDHFVASAEIYDPTAGTFATTGPLTAERALHTATLLADGRVLVTGGINNDNNGGTSLASAELYDPTTGMFTATGSMADARTFHGAAMLSDGRVLVTGGVHTGWDYAAPFLASAELYDPTTGEFTATGPMTDKRVSHTATLLGEGRVLIAGGYDGSSWGGGPPWPDVTTAEFYDPLTGIFGPTGSGR